MIEILDYLLALKLENRHLIGIVGTPGAGKSFLSEKIKANATKLGIKCQILSMDGYHKSNEELANLNLSNLKGIPETFNVVEFINKLKEIKFNQNKIIQIPKFNRNIEAVEENALQIELTDKLILVEGNYLLLNQTPWNEVKNYLDETWMIECSLIETYKRLLKRHNEKNLGINWSKQKIKSTDYPNFKLIKYKSSRPDKTVVFSDDKCYLKFQETY